ncbi:HAD-IA family hydrolase [Candidatus Woesearchaeota archaeon]|nr:HAD-IA family hydrolase [Candidatus Woesearchaeota archaeon]
MPALQRKIEAVIFDLYDTLIYLSRPTDPYAALFAALGIHDMHEAARLALTEPIKDFSDLASKLRPGHSIDIQSCEQQLSLELASAALFPETQDSLIRLRNEGYRTGVISNLSSPHKSPFFDLGLDKLVDSYLFSCDEGIKKPDREIYQRMLKRLNVSPDRALMVGDSLYCDVFGPQSVGIDAILLDRRNDSTEPRKIQNLQKIFRCL